MKRTTGNEDGFHLRKIFLKTRYEKGIFWQLEISQAYNSETLSYKFMRGISLRKIRKLKQTLFSK